MNIRIILKSGVEFTVKCKEFTLERNGLGAVTGYEIGGITENKPIYLDFSQVPAIIRTDAGLFTSSVVQEWKAKKP